MIDGLSACLRARRAPFRAQVRHAVRALNHDGARCTSDRYAFHEERSFPLPDFTPRLRRKRHSLRFFYAALPIVQSGFSVAAARGLFDRHHNCPAARALLKQLDEFEGMDMDDLLYLGLTVALFALSAALVYALEKLRRPQ